PERTARGDGGASAGDRLRTRRMRQRRSRQWVFRYGKRRSRCYGRIRSIDGPPPQVFDRMVSVLDSESKLRSVSIVSREGAATYRVRRYLSAQVNRGRAVIARVWDRYDRDQQRALRLGGEEAGRKVGRDPWAAA